MNWPVILFLRPNSMIATVRLNFLLATACARLCRLGVAATLGAGPAAAGFFVSPQGRDTWSGKRADPGENDGPFATAARARDAVRALLKTQKEPRRVRVVLRGGTYYLDSSLEFGPEDSGTEGAPVVYAAARGEKVVISGGRRLEGGRWGEVNGRKAWVVSIPEVKQGQWRFRQLFVNGARRPRTRLPKGGEYHIESLPGYTGDFLRSPTKQFVYMPGNIVPTWHNLRDVEIVGITRWLDNRLPIESVSEQTRTVTFDRPSLFALLSGSQPGTYWVENVFEALDTPGQWYLDRPQGKLYYLPRPGEEMLSAEIVAPRLPQVVRVVGRADAPIHDVRFEGLIFAHTEWQPPADYASSLQAGIEVPGALLFDYAERCAVTDGGIEHIGNYGIEVGVGCADIEIARNQITDIGAGGIRIGHFFSWETDGSGRLTERGLQRKAAMPQGPHSQRITVADNEIARCGRFTPEAVGVFVGDNADNKVIHNHIYDLFYSGISVGSVQDFGVNHAQSNVVEYNHIHDVGQGMLSDMGGIYTCSTPGTRIRYNLVHDVSRRDYGGWGIYTDEGSHEVLIQNNLVYRCQDGALFAHHSRTIAAENNILALNSIAQVDRGGIGGFELTFQRNLIYYLEGKAVGDYGIVHYGRDVCTFDRNLYWNASGKPVLFGNKSFAEWQAAGQDKNSVIADPLFVDPEKGDFRLRPGSPAAQISFEPWDFSAVGPRPHPAASKQKPVAALADTGSAPAQAAPSVGKHKMLELIFTAAGTPANPFDTYLLKLEVTDPAGRIFGVEGFYDGDGNGGQTGRTWKVRLCPYQTVRWTWRTVPGDAPDGGLAGLSGQFDCIESGDLGGLAAQGRYFRLQDGDFFFPVGNFLDHASGLPLWSYLGETVTDAQRDAIIARHRDFHTANKYMIYMSNRSDPSGEYSEIVTPWLGTAANSDKTKMDLGRWKLYDGYLQRMKDTGLSAYISLFEDGKPGNYGRLPMADRKRFMRYAMARTSAFSHVWYVLCFEWQEAWSKTEVNEAGKFIQEHNPWKRLLSVHDWAGTPWAFAGETWPAYIASQDGNDANPDAVNSYVISLRAHGLPVLADELGSNRTDSDARIRGNMWAAFCAGAAGTGTGTDLKAFQRFLAQSRIPFQRMGPSNGLVQGGGSSRFCLAESGHHYLAYSTTGSFTLSVTGTGLTGRWFNPRDPNAPLGTSFGVSSGTSTFTPPDATCDWALWVTDGTNLTNGVTRLSTEATVVQVVVGGAGPN
ncbi:MAG: right-handed parallel beta-helix repeat-containing protein [bacterium]|nr:right-handed parallel beta-helix repeat-containing protein [bacterium]